MTLFFCADCHTAVGPMRSNRFCRCGYPSGVYTTTGPSEAEHARGLALALRERVLRQHPGMIIPEETLAQQAAREAAMYRAGGNVICDVCAYPYRSHPADLRFDFLTLLCNGDRVKL